MKILESRRINLAAADTLKHIGIEGELYYNLVIMMLMRNVTEGWVRLGYVTLFTLMIILMIFEYIMK